MTPERVRHEGVDQPVGRPTVVDYPARGSGERDRVGLGAREQPDPRFGGAAWLLHTAQRQEGEPVRIGRPTRSASVGQVEGDGSRAVIRVPDVEYTGISVRVGVGLPDRKGHRSSVRRHCDLAQPPDLRVLLDGDRGLLGLRALQRDDRRQDRERHVPRISER